MGYKVPREVIAATTRCKTHFKCLKEGVSARSQLCDVKYSAGQHLLIINATPPSTCLYQAPLGYGYTCTCPVHYSLFHQGYHAKIPF